MLFVYQLLLYYNKTKALKADATNISIPIISHGGIIVTDNEKALILQNNRIKTYMNFRLVIDHLDEIVIVLNEDRQFVFWNKAIDNLLLKPNNNLLGLRPGEVFNCIHIRENIGECGTTEFCKNCGAFNSIVTALSGESNTNECRIIRSKLGADNILNLKVKSNPIYIEDEKFILFILSDISEIKAGRVLENTFYQLFQNMHSGVAIYEEVDGGEDFVIQFLNEAATKIENVMLDQIIGKRVTDVFPGVVDFGILEVFREVWQTGTPINKPISFYEDNRITGWRENYVFKLPSGEIVAIYEDITEQKKAEEIFIDSKKWVDLILNTVNTGIVIIEPDTHIIKDVNGAAVEMIGIEKDKIIGQVCHKFICPAECEQCPITDLGKEVDNSERVLIDVDGNHIPILKTVSMGIHNNEKYLIESFLDISVQKELEKKLAHLSSVDELTQIGNRRAFENELHKSIDYCHFNKTSIAAIMIDIDLFKDFNDSYGHLEGDECLYRVANIIKDNLKRPYDHVYRYGGEEFIVILSDVDDEGARIVAERIRQAICDAKIEHKKSSVSKYVTVSLGIYVHSKDIMITGDDMVNNADKRLYEAKKSGRNCVK